jgi:HEAT repeat protein
VPGLVDALKDKEPAVRKSAASLLAQLGADAQASVPALREALKDDTTQIAAARALWKIAKDETGIPVLMQTLKAGELSARREAVSALAEFGPQAKPVVGALVATLGDKDEVRGPASMTLAGMGSAAVPAVAAVLQDKDERVRVGAAYVLSRIGKDAKEAVPALAEALADQNLYVGYLAAEALAKIGPEAKAAAPALAAALHTEAMRVDDAFPVGKGDALRDITAVALAKIGPDAKEAIPVLIDVVEWRKYRSRTSHDFDIERLRATAADALRRISRETPKTLAPKLIAGLKDKDPGIRWRTASALGHLGPDATEAMPALTHALKDADPYVRDHAAEALKRIDLPAAKKAGVK